MHFLVVEDDTHGQNVLRTLLTHHQVGVDVAGDARQALALIEAHDYTAVLIDLTLPGISGWQLLTNIRQHNPTMPCFAVTAFHSSRVAQEALKAGFTAYFPKPIDVNSFFTEISQYLN